MDSAAWMARAGPSSWLRPGRPNAHTARNPFSSHRNCRRVVGKWQQPGNLAGWLAGRQAGRRAGRQQAGVIKSTGTANEIVHVGAWHGQHDDCKRRHDTRHYPGWPLWRSQCPPHPHSALLRCLNVQDNLPVGTRRRAASCAAAPPPCTTAPPRAPCVLLRGQTAAAAPAGRGTPGTELCPPCNHEQPHRGVHAWVCTLMRLQAHVIQLPAAVGSNGADAVQGRQQPGSHLSSFT